MNRVLVNVFFPRIGKKYDVWIPLNKRLYKVIESLIRGVNELNDNIYKTDELPLLYDKETGKPYDLNWMVGETNIRNGIELIII